MNTRYTCLSCELDDNDKIILLRAKNLLEEIAAHFETWQQNEDIPSIDHCDGFSLDDINDVTNLLLNIISEGHIEYIEER